jgi:hypothetical protein
MSDLGILEVPRKPRWGGTGTISERWRTQLKEAMVVESQEHAAECRVQ